MVDRITFQTVKELMDKGQLTPIFTNVAEALDKYVKAEGKSDSSATAVNAKAFSNSAKDLLVAGDEPAKEKGLEGYLASLRSKDPHVGFTTAKELFQFLIDEKISDAMKVKIISILLDDELIPETKRQGVRFIGLALTRHNIKLPSEGMKIYFYKLLTFLPIDEPGKHESIAAALWGFDFKLVDKEHLPGMAEAVLQKFDGTENYVQLKLLDSLERFAGLDMPATAVKENMVEAMLAALEIGTKPIKTGAIKVLNSLLWSNISPEHKRGIVQGVYKLIEQEKLGIDIFCQQETIFIPTIFGNNEISDEFKNNFLDLLVAKDMATPVVLRDSVLVCEDALSWKEKLLDVLVAKNDVDPYIFKDLFNAYSKMPKMPEAYMTSEKKLLDKMLDKLLAIANNGSEEQKLAAIDVVFHFISRGNAIGVEPDIRSTSYLFSEADIDKIVGQTLCLLNDESEKVREVASRYFFALSEMKMSKKSTGDMVQPLMQALNKNSGPALLDTMSSLSELAMLGFSTGEIVDALIKKKTEMPPEIIGTVFWDFLGLILSDFCQEEQKKKLFGIIMADAQNESFPYQAEAVSVLASIASSEGLNEFKKQIVQPLMQNLKSANSAVCMESAIALGKLAKSEILPKEKVKIAKALFDYAEKTTGLPRKVALASLSGYLALKDLSLGNSDALTDMYLAELDVQPKKTHRIEKHKKHTTRGIIIGLGELAALKISSEKRKEILEAFNSFVGFREGKMSETEWVILANLGAARVYCAMSEYDQMEKKLRASSESVAKLAETAKGDDYKTVIEVRGDIAHLYEQAAAKVTDEAQRTALLQKSIDENLQLAKWAEENQDWDVAEKARMEAADKLGQLGKTEEAEKVRKGIRGHK